MLPEGYKKKSFRRFDIDIDVDRLVAEYESIPEEAWMNSYWGDIHCSVGMMLLRGGNEGNSEAFYSDSVFDAPILDQLPYIKHFMAEDGPFGGAIYGFFFRMEPGGVSRKHRDLMSQWEDLYRVHIPIVTNPGAFLIASNRSMHFALGSAWTFDNFKDHGVVNGDGERLHLIFDVPLNEKMKRLIDEAEVLKGTEDMEHIKRISDPAPKKESYPGDPFMARTIDMLEKRLMSNKAISEYLNDEKIPTRIYARDGWNESMVAELREQIEK